MSSLKRVLLSVTHLGSGSLPLLGLLDRNPRVQFVQTNPVIGNYVDLKMLTSNEHKLNSMAAMYAFDLNYNFQLGPRNPLPHVNYLFVMRPPEQVLNLLVSQKVYQPREAAMYYCFRLRRMCEIAKRVNNGMLLTYENITNGEYVNPLGRFLGLKEQINHSDMAFEHLKCPGNFNKGLLDWCSDAYERHLFFMKNLPLIHS